MVNPDCTQNIPDRLGEAYWMKEIELGSAANKANILSAMLSFQPHLPVFPFFEIFNNIFI